MANNFFFDKPAHCDLLLYTYSIQLSLLAQVVAWYQTGAKQLFEPMMIYC